MPTKKKAPARKSVRAAAARPALIVVVPGGGPVPEALLAFAAALEPAREVLEAESVKSGLALRARTPIVLVSEEPGAAIAAALEAGERADAALERWKETGSAIVAELTSTRRTLPVISRQALAARPGESADVLRKALKLKGETPDHLEASDANGGGLIALLATQLVEADPEAQKLAERLAGIVRPPAQSVDADALSDLVHGGQAAQLEEELKLLRDDIAEMQNRLSQRVLNASLRQTAEEVAENRRVQIAERAADRQNVLGAGLLALSKQRDAAAAELAELRAAFETQARDLDAAEARLADIYRSRSWKLTAPMRAVRLGLNRT